MTTDNTDNTDEPTKAELHDRVRKLESTVEKLMPSRRDALRMGAAGLAGAAGLGAASQSADASTGSAGDIGSSGSRPDLFADQIDANTLTSTTTETQFGSDISEVTAIDSVAISSSASQTVTIPSGFSTVKIELSATSNSPDIFRIRINGLSSNYTQTDVDGTTRTGRSSWRIGSVNNTQLVGSLTIRTAPETIGQGSAASDMNPVIIGPAVGDGGNGIVGGELQQRVVTVDTVEFLPTGSDTDYQVDIRGYSFN